MEDETSPVATDNSLTWKYNPSPAIRIRVRKLGRISLLPLAHIVGVVSSFLLGLGLFALIVAIAGIGSTDLEAEPFYLRLGTWLFGSGIITGVGAFMISHVSEKKEKSVVV